MSPAPDSAASIAASIVLTLRRERNDALTSAPPDSKVHELGEDTLSNEITL